MNIQLKDKNLLRHQAYIDGMWMSSKNGKVIEIHNPGNGQLLGVVPNMGAQETRLAILAAEEGAKKWSALTAKARASILMSWHREVLAHKNDLALILSSEQGKPLAEALGEILYAASYIEWFAEEGKRVYGDIIPATQENKRILVQKQAIGVCAGITPWNFPSSMITRKVAPALAAGCSIIIKPASQTPYSALALVDLAERAGVPNGVFSVITGDAEEIGRELCSSSTVRKLSFTGSTSIGAKLAAQCAPTIKKLSLELGGNAPFIVFEDADIDEAVKGAIDSKFRNSGQTCVCTNRIFVQAGVYQAFSEKLTLAVKKLKLGLGTEADVTQGPLINMNAVTNLEDMLADGINQGASILIGGQRSSLGGTFFEPTIVANVKPSMMLFQQEIFGPIASLIKFESESEVVRLANDTEFGLAAYFYTKDLGRTWRVSEALEYGMVGVNAGLISSEVAPFGGVKSSGLGREGSKYGIEEYLEMKYVCVSGLEKN